jgi:hypothetical protein
MEIKNKIENLIAEILKQQFSSIPQKQTIKYASNGNLYIACPFCGDSKTNLNKKRCCIYLDTLSYYCFNCSASGNLIYFFKHFGIDSYDLLDLEKINLEITNKPKQTIIDIFEKSDLTIIQELKSILIPYNEIIKLYDLIDPIGDAKLEILKRNLITNDKLKSSKDGNKLYILNTIKIENELYISYINIKNINSKFKYYILNLEKIYKDTGKDFESIKHLYEKYNRSLNIFNYLNLNLDKQFFVFEGELDSLLFEQLTNIQSIALSGASKELSNNLINAIYFYDADATGLKKSIQTLKENKNIFLFSKFCKDVFNLNTKQFKKLDFTDLILYLINKQNMSLDEIKNKIKTNINNHISNNQLDVLFI